jgi:hypothetical protein
MDNIHNFTNRMLCEYASIFPTVAALLDHLLFTVGNGYSVDPNTGMIREDYNDGKFIHQFPTLNKQGWNKLIAECHNKERKFAEKCNFGLDYKIDEEQITKNCEKYKVVSVNDLAFTELALLNDLIKLQAERQADRSGMSDVYLRPYPLSENYSDIYNLNKNTPKWFLEIALNFCNAWIAFLNEAIENDNVWKIPGEKKFTQDQKEREELAERLIDEILAEEGKVRPDTIYHTPTSDYADLNWTTKHRDMLVKLEKKLRKLIGKKNGNQESN